MARESIDGLRKAAMARIETDPGSAVAIYEKLLALDPEDIESWANSGGLLHRLGQHAKATEAFERVKWLAEREGNTEWLKYAQRSITRIKREQGPVAAQHSDEPLRNGAVADARPQGAAEMGLGAAGSPRQVSMGGALLAFAAATGFLTLVVSGAVSQLWHYPFVRSALLRSTDDLLASAAVGYLGAILLQKVVSKYLAIRLFVCATAAALFVAALYFLVNGLIPLGSVFEECTRVVDMPQSCNIQIEQYQTLPPEQRRELDIL